mgnify:CR=1 FL=1
MTIEELKVIITAQTSGLNREISAARQQIGRMAQQAEQSQKRVSATFSGIKKAILSAGIAVSVQKITAGIKDLAIEAIGLESQIENLNRTMGANKSWFLDWAKSNASAFGISESAAIKYGNTYSNLISGFISDTSSVTVYTKQLMEASAVIASRTGRTVEDVNERIRSGLLGNTEAIEDLGINVNVALLETTDAFKQLANGRSWEQLTFQEQQQVRLFSIMEQSAKKFGTTLAGGGATSLLKFNAQLENLKLELGRAFAPLVETILPALTEFISKLADGVKWISAFFSALRGETQAVSNAIDQTASGAQSTAEGLKNANDAAKALNRTLAGFDELHVINQSSVGSGSSTVGPSNSDDSIQIPDDGAVDSARKFEKILNDITKKFSPTITAWKKAFKEISESVDTSMQRAGNAINKAWNESLGPFFGYVTGEFIPKIVNEFSETLAPVLGDIMPVMFDEFSKDFETACSTISDATDNILKPAFERAETAASDIMDGVKNSWNEHGEEILSNFEGFKSQLRTVWNSIYEDVIKKSADNIGKKWDELWEKHLGPLASKITYFGGAISEVVSMMWNQILMPFVTWIVGKFGPPITNVINGIMGVVESIWGLISTVVSTIIGYLNGLLTFVSGVFSGDWEKAWNGIKLMFAEVWNGNWQIVKGTINLIIDALNLLWTAIYNVAKGIVDGIGGIAGAIGDVFGQDWHFSMPEEPPLIPKLASGGLAYGPTLAMIGEGRDREAVLPLNQSVYAEIAKGINSQGNPAVILLLEKILDAVLQIDPNIIMDGQSLATASSGYYAAEQRRTGPSVLRVV